MPNREDERYRAGNEIFYCPICQVYLKPELWAIHIHNPANKQITPSQPITYSGKREKRIVLPEIDAMMLWAGIKKFIAVVFTVAVLFSAAYTVGRQFGFDPFNPPTKFAAQIREQTNEARSKYSLASLTECKLVNDLAKIRVAHVSDYYEQNNDLEHYLFKSDVSSASLRLGSVGENLFYVQEGFFCFYLCIPIGRSGTDMVDGWMNSIGHRQNILDDQFQFIGVEVKRIGSKVFAVQLFSSECRTY